MAAYRLNADTSAEVQVNTGFRAGPEFPIFQHVEGTSTNRLAIRRFVLVSTISRLPRVFRACT